MPLDLTVGDAFPDVTMVDHDGNATTIAEIGGDRPLFLAFYRGPW